MPFDGMEAYKKINDALPTVLVSGCETELNRFTVQPWLDSGAIDIVQTDCNVTGITDNWYISRIAHIRGIISCPHNWHGGGTTMANAFLNAGARAVVGDRNTSWGRKYRLGPSIQSGHRQGAGYSRRLLQSAQSRMDQPWRSDCSEVGCGSGVGGAFLIHQLRQLLFQHLNFAKQMH